MADHSHRSRPGNEQQQQWSQHRHRPSGGPAYTPVQVHPPTLQVDGPAPHAEGPVPALPPKSPRMKVGPSPGPSPIRAGAVHPQTGGGGYPPPPLPGISIVAHPPPPVWEHERGKSPGTTPQRSPLLEKLRQTFVAREPMSRTWAKKSYVDELDGATATATAAREEGGGGVRSAPPSVLDHGHEEDLEAGPQFRSVFSSSVM